MEREREAAGAGGDRTLHTGGRGTIIALRSAAVPTGARRPQRRLGRSLILALLIPCLLAPGARAEFGFKGLDLGFTGEGGSPATQAGSHPFAWTTTLAFNTHTDPTYGELPDQDLKDLRIELPPGLMGTPPLLPRCSHADFGLAACPPSTAIGTIELNTSAPETKGETYPLYDLTPLSGAAAELAFSVAGVNTVIEIAVRPAPPYNLIASISNVTDVVAVFGSVLTVHGVPGAAPFLTLPRSCAAAIPTFEADSWQAPGRWVSSQPPEPLAFTGCGSLGFSPTITARPTTASAGAPSGIDLSLDAPDEGLTSPTGTAQADLSKAVLTFPAGMTINPSLAAGLGACTAADLARETLASAPGEGCPQAAKIGTAALSTPLLEDPVKGTLFVAQPDDPATAAPGAENPFDSPFALDLVLRDAERGILLKQPIAIAPDPQSGRLTTTIAAIPQLPFTHFELHFNAGPHAPLRMPACGSHAIAYQLIPSSGGAPLSGEAGFATTRNCAPPGFAPNLSAGTTNPRAGAASPFVLDLSSASGQQNLADLLLTLPAGLSADFAAVPTCPEPDTATGNCPPDSRLGYARIALGPGPEPLWIPEEGRAQSSVYLSGPYRGAPYSLLVVVPAQAGPFDLGTVITRAAIFIDPQTAQARVRLDPLPQILAGVPIEYRTIRLVLDRPGFILNPTNCEATRVTASAATASGAVAALADRFQVADCANLGFRPRFGLRLSGALVQNGHPALTALLRPRPGDANLRAATITVPRGELIDPARLRGVCARADFAISSCPAASRLGSAQALSPLLPSPLRGSIYLRESDGRYPDLAIALSGPPDLELIGHIATAPGLVRASFEQLPDIPLSRLRLEIEGGRRGLFVNSTDLCRHRARAGLALLAQDGAARALRPRATASCWHLTVIH